MTRVDIETALQDKYSAEELVEKLNLDVSDIVMMFEETILEEFSEDGLLSEEWRDFYESDQDI